MTHRSNNTARDTKTARRNRADAARPTLRLPSRPVPPVSGGLSRAELREIVLEVLG